MIKHSVIFNFKPEIDSSRMKLFFSAADKLADIPGVIDFRKWKQVSVKNTYQYGLTMEFDSNDELQKYIDHTTHATFINEQWIPCVADFLEIDYEPLQESLL
ncbi:MAG: Dabb family protein [Chitinophagaceae bacterium]